MSDTVTMTLTDFLLARIGEDEHGIPILHDPTDEAAERWIVRWLDDVGAKRRIVGWLVDALDAKAAAEADPTQTWAGDQYLRAMALAAEALAVPYDAHPDRAHVTSL